MKTSILRWMFFRSKYLILTVVHDSLEISSLAMPKPEGKSQIPKKIFNPLKMMFLLTFSQLSGFVPAKPFGASSHITASSPMLELLLPHVPGCVKLQTLQLRLMDLIPTYLSSFPRGGRAQIQESL